MRNRPLKAVKNGLLFGLVGAIYLFLNALPLALARKLGAGLGRLFFVLVPYERKKTLRQLALAFPEKGEAERRAIGIGVLGHRGRGGAEFMRFPRLSMNDLEGWVGECTGFEAMAACVKGGRGAVAVT